MRFKFFAESGVDIFGFERGKEEALTNDELDNKPLKSFDTDLMMRYLSRHKIGVSEAYVPFMNEVRWGEGYGAVRLEVTPRMLFLIQREGKDIEGNPRWITKQTFQLNRRGYGGYEEAVAAEVYDYVKLVSESGLEGPNPKWDGLASLTDHMATKLRRCAQPKFLFRGIKKVVENNYQIIFEVGAQGVQSPGQMRVEQVVVDLSYDPACGTLRIRNYAIESKVGRERSWRPQPSYLDTWHFPAQDRSEICEAHLIMMKYY
jgi:hypothetical protein